MSRFWAVGVGPGDPTLLTVKAVHILTAADAVYHAGPADDRGRALDVVRSFLRPDLPTRTVLAEPMTAVSAAPGREAYRAGVERIAADCRRGLAVAFITEGDPTLYSTASQVWQLLEQTDPTIPIEVVPGVSSVTAAAARVRWPLARRDEPLAVVPASYHADGLPALLDTFPNLCLLKAGQALPRLREVLAVRGPDCEAVYVENLGTEREWVTRDLEAAAGRGEYFSLVLVRHASPLPRTRGRGAGGEGGGVGCVRLFPLTPGPSPPSTGERGEELGKLWVIGLGPGDAAVLTPQALQALRSADVVLGYDGYLAPLRGLGLTAELRGSPIGAERERASEALRVAAAGRRVALVSSGDAGVYGMGSLVLETAGTIPEVEVEVVPGVTAALAAAALLGAPLGHDFACVSLSDLLTPWEVIERRLEAAGQGDFVLALYNPVSQRRTWQLPRAREILLKYRAPSTPAGLVDRAYRPGASVRLTTLGELAAEGVGMETVVLIGSSQTRVVRGRMVTPRGYGGGP